MKKVISMKRLVASSTVAVLMLCCVRIVLATPQATETPAKQQAAAPLTFTVTYDSSIADSFSGRVYVMFSGGRPEPRFGPSWFGTHPFFALDVKDWKAGEPLVFDDHAISFPDKLSTIAEKHYAVQAVLRRNVDSPSIGLAPGNAYSPMVRQLLDGQTSGAIKLHINKVVEHRPFRESAQIKLAEIKSELLSTFHGREVKMRAAVLLPKGYDEAPQRRYPAMYWIGGFGGDHTAVPFMHRLWTATGFDDQIVRVILDPSCYGGHHVFADSANNGPRGTALVNEFIPYLERTHRLVASPHARFLSGHSSGGWSSLWLQITYPEFFGGTWSVAPDPVDFRSFQNIDLYRPGANMYVDETGQRRPLARNGEQIMAWYDEFAKMEVVYGEGGQLRSFEWVFSPHGADGLPKPLYDRATGAVNHDVAEDWKRFDIRLVLEEHWNDLAPKLQGGRKINVFMGELDTFYLEGATKLLKESQDRLGSKAVIIIEPGRDHGSIASPDLRKRIDEEIMHIFSHHHPEYAPAAILDPQP